MSAIDPPTKATADEPARERAPFEVEKLGVALSGGGIRSASFSLGALQHLAPFAEAWQQGDGDERPAVVLSTVSGGGWAGALTVATLVTGPDAEGEPAPAAANTPSFRERAREAVVHFRKNASYLAPSGGGAKRSLPALIAAYLHGLSLNLLEVVGSVLFVVGALGAIIHTMAIPIATEAWPRHELAAAHDAGLVPDLTDAQDQSYGTVLLPHARLPDAPSASSTHDASPARILSGPRSLVPLSPDAKAVLVLAEVHEGLLVRWIPADRLICDRERCRAQLFDDGFLASNEPAARSVLRAPIERFRVFEWTCGGATGSDCTRLSVPLVRDTDEDEGTLFARVVQSTPTHAPLYLLVLALLGLVPVVLAAAVDRARRLRLQKRGGVIVLALSLLSCAGASFAAFVVAQQAHGLEVARIAGVAVGIACATFIVLAMPEARRSRPVLWLVIVSTVVSSAAAYAWMDRLAGLITPIDVWLVDRLSVLLGLEEARRIPGTVPFGLDASVALAGASTLQFLWLGLVLVITHLFERLQGTPDEARERAKRERRDGARVALWFIGLVIVGWAFCIVASTGALSPTGTFTTVELLKHDAPLGSASRWFVALVLLVLGGVLLAALPRGTRAARISALALGLVGAALLLVLFDGSTALIGYFADVLQGARYGDRMFAPVAVVEACQWAVIVGAGLYFGAAFGRQTLSRGVLSPHYLYRDRIAQAFLRNRDWTLADLGARLSAKYEWVINAVANASEPQAYELGTKLAGPVPDFSTATTDIPELRGDTSVAKALAISAAAVSPQMGLYTNPWMWWITSALNLRLGARLPTGPSNASGKPPPWKRIPFLPVGVSQIEGQIYATDGGHYDNSGVAALLRRRCDAILAIDGEHDGQGGYAGLSHAIRVARQHGIDVDIDLSEVVPDAKGMSRAPCAVGTISYPATGDQPAKQGILVYLKPVASPTDPVEVRDYRVRNPEFPHQSTANQFFTVEQFDAYRQLGFASMATALAPLHSRYSRHRTTVWTRSPEEVLRDVDGAFLELRRAWRVPRAIDPDSFTRASDGWIHLLHPSWQPGVTAGADGLVLATIQHMEQVFERARLWKTVEDPDSIAWVRLFASYWERDDFRRVWAAKSQFFGADFVSFCETVLGYTERVGGKPDQRSEPPPPPPAAPPTAPSDIEA